MPCCNKTHLLSLTSEYDCTNYLHGKKNVFFKADLTFYEQFSPMIKNYRKIVQTNNVQKNP